MVQEVVDVGTIANDRTGDTWRAAMIKLNNNNTELFAFLSAQPTNVIVINAEADFPTQDATTITLDANTRFFIGTAFSTAKTFTVLNGSSITSINPFAVVLTYTGTGTMFNSSNASWEINNIGYSCISGTIFSVSGTGRAFLMDNAACFGVTNIGSFTDITVAVDSSSIVSITGQGFDFSGTISNLSISTLIQITSSATHIGLNLNTAVFTNLDISAYEPSGPAGSIAISGAVSSANVAANKIATVNNSTLNGDAMTPLSGVTNKDIRWKFVGNGGVSDTLVDGLVSISGNTTETVISASSTPVKLNATFVVERESLYTCDTTGRCTYNGERDDTPPLGASVTLDVASGANKAIKVYLAKNGTIISNSGVPTTVSAGKLEMVTILWQENTVKDDFYEIFLENNTDTVNVIATDGTLRVR